MSVAKCPSCGNTFNVPEKKTGLWWGIGCLVAAMAIPFIVASIGLLAAIAIPSFVKAREASQLNACVNYMRILDAAKEQATIEHNYKSGDPISEADIEPFIKNRFGSLVCPRGGHYAVNPVDQEPECSVHGALSSALEKRRSPNRQTEGIRR